MFIVPCSQIGRYLHTEKFFVWRNSIMYEDMMIQELTEDQLEQVVGGKKAAASSDPSVLSSVTVTNFNVSTNSNSNTATSSSSSSATGGSATASTGPITIPLVTI